MVTKIRVYTIGYRSLNRVSIGTLLMAESDDGDMIEKVIYRQMPNITKNQADVIAITMALQCIKPEYRQGTVELYAPPNYAFSMVDKNDDGSWKLEPKINIDEINAARVMIDKYSGLKLKKNNATSPEFKRCIEAARDAIRSDQPISDQIE